MTTPRVTINGRFLTRPISGVERTAHEVVQALATHTDLVMDIAVPACDDPAQAQAFGAKTGLPVRFGHLKGHIWEQLELPLQSRGRMVFSPCNTGPIAKQRHTVVIHDAQTFDIPENFSGAFRRFYQILLPLLGRRAQHIVTVSDFSKTRLVDLGICDTAHVVPNAVDHFARISPDPSRVPQTPFVLAMGSSAPHKNFQFICDIFAKTPGLPPLYVAGGHASGVFARNTAQNMPHVTFLGRVSDAELAGLYNQAAAFVFPSLYEGFGIPPLEAMWWGCPVIAANTTAIPEACGPAALLCDPTDDRAWITALHTVLHSPDIANRLRALGHAQARAITWADIAQHYARILGGDILEIGS
ncbi:MAG: glycosyltransferase family 1 protein [Pseudomonadota bacterium]